MEIYVEIIIGISFGARIEDASERTSKALYLYLRKTSIWVVMYGKDEKEYTILCTSSRGSQARFTAIAWNRQLSLRHSRRQLFSNRRHEFESHPRRHLLWILVVPTCQYYLDLQGRTFHPRS
jgi:hypothetical protein